MDEKNNVTEFANIMIKSLIKIPYISHIKTPLTKIIYLVKDNPDVFPVLIVLMD